MKRAYPRIQAWKRCMYLAQRCTNMRSCAPSNQPTPSSSATASTLTTTPSASSSPSAPSPTPAASGTPLFCSTKSAPPTPTCTTPSSGPTPPARTHICDLSMHYFRLMLKDIDSEPDNFAFHFAILGCVSCCWIGMGGQMHFFVVKNGLVAADAHVQTAILRLYVECGVLGDAHKMFDEIPERDMIQWNVIMNGYVKRGLASEGLTVFQDMLVRGIEPDGFCVATGIAACAHLGALWQGKWVHEYVRKREGLKSDVFIGTALVDMYANCGCIDLAVEVFEGMGKRNVVSWLAMIGAYGVHGYAAEAISCLERMQVDDEIKPDGVVLLGVLTACNHAGSVEKGKALLDNMKAQYGIVPKHEHYSCVIDLLCKAGRLSDALELFRRMPMKPLASVWGALLSGCRIHNNVDLAEIAVEHLLLVANDDRGEEVGAYVQLSNIYFGPRRSEEALRIRKMIGEKGIKKTPGCSMLEVDGKVNEFVSGDVARSHRVQICTMLDLISVDSVQDSQNYL